MDEEEEEKHPIFCPVCGSVGCVIDHEAKTEEILKFAQEHRNDYQDTDTCNLCGEEILDLELGAIVSPFGECCGDCVNEIKGAK